MKLLALFVALTVVAIVESLPGKYRSSKYETFTYFKVIAQSNFGPEANVTEKLTKAKQIIEEIERDAVDVELDEAIEKYDYPFIEDDTKQFKGDRDKQIAISQFG